MSRLILFLVLCSSTILKAQNHAAFVSNSSIVSNNLKANSHLSNAILNLDSTIEMNFPSYLSIDGNIEIKVTKKLIGGHIIVKSATGTKLFTFDIKKISNKFILFSSGKFYITVLDKDNIVYKTEKIIIE